MKRKGGVAPLNFRVPIYIQVEIAQLHDWVESAVKNVEESEKLLIYLDTAHPTKRMINALQDKLELHQRNLKWMSDQLSGKIIRFKSEGL